MNPLVAGLFDNFCAEQELTELPEDDAFELFAAQLVLTADITEQSDITDLLLDKGTPGIDVAVLAINGQPVSDQDDVEDAAAPGTKLDVSVHLIQAKRSESCDSTQILGFGDIAERFLKNDNVGDYPLLSQRSFALKTIFEKHAAQLKSKPAVTLSYVTTCPPKALTDESVQLRRESVEQQIESLGFLGTVKVQLLGANDLHELWTQRQHANEVDLQFQRQINLPEMPGVDQAILGVVSASELTKLVTDADGILDERVFYDNVRGFQGMETNSVNQSILDTLASTDRDLVPVLNNGVTVVARSYKPKPGDTVQLADYQIVNGCQTTHCLFYALDSLGEQANQVFVPLRLVVTTDEDVANRIVRATNSQTPVTENDLVALTRFQKRLEDFYKVDGAQVSLIYERRPGQFFDQAVTKTRLVTIFDQMRAISSVFLDNPHMAARYASRLYNEVGSELFREDHRLLPYVASAFASYRLENAFRTGLDTRYKVARYHLLMAFKYQVLGGGTSPLGSNLSESQAQILIDALKKPAHVKLFQDAALAVESAGLGSMPTRDRLKRLQFTQELITFLTTGAAPAAKP